MPKIMIKKYQQGNKITPVFDVRYSSQEWHEKPINLDKWPSGSKYHYNSSIQNNNLKRKIYERNTAARNIDLMRSVAGNTNVLGQLFAGVLELGQYFNILPEQEKEIEVVPNTKKNEQTTKNQQTAGVERQDGGTIDIMGYRDDSPYKNR